MKYQRISKIGTKAYHDYFESFKKINSYYNFFINMVDYTETAQIKAHDVLYKFAEEEKKKELLSSWEKRMSPLIVLENHRQFFLEVILVRHVENYLAYLSALFMTCLYNVQKQ